MKWFSVWWYKVLFERPSTYSDASRFRVMWCRVKNHPAGVWWYNPGGSEPNMHCKNCGDNLG